MLFVNCRFGRLIRPVVAQQDVLGLVQGAVKSAKNGIASKDYLR